jgi:hypothetical protein
MPTNVEAILGDTLHAILRIPGVILECAETRKARGTGGLASLAAEQGWALPEWVGKLYAESGGAHLSWRLSALGYERLDPERDDAGARYDISGNLDILSPEEARGGFTDEGWRPLYGARLGGYVPIDFSGFFLNAGFEANTHSEGVTIFSLYDECTFSTGVSWTEYLARGAELLFMREWQRAFLTDDESVRHVAHLTALKNRLVPHDRTVTPEGDRSDD